MISSAEQSAGTVFFVGEQDLLDFQPSPEYGFFKEIVRPY